MIQIQFDPFIICRVKLRANLVRVA